MKLNRFILALMAIFLLMAAVFGSATPAAAQDPQTFCEGDEGMLFSPENPLPSSAPCEGVTRYTLIEPWRAGCEGASTDPDCNVGFQMTDTWPRILQWLQDNGFDRGSVWAEPKTDSGPAASPAQPEPSPADTAGFPEWLFFALIAWMALTMLGLIGWGISALVKRRRRTSTPTA